MSMNSKNSQRGIPTQTRLSDYFKPKPNASSNTCSTPSSPFFSVFGEISKSTSDIINKEVHELRNKRSQFRIALQKKDFSDSTNSLESEFTSKLNVPFSLTHKSECYSNVDDDSLPAKKKKKIENYTPLENQVIQLKEKYPNVLLAIEVGYKYRFFGDDAKVAADHLNVVCWHDRNFLTASVSSHKIQTHIRRLVSDGFKVGLVQQVETAPLKFISKNKYTPFERELVQMYTDATLIDGKTSMLAFDPSTGDLIYDSFFDSSLKNELNLRLDVLAPKELILLSVSDIFKSWILKYKNNRDTFIRVEEIGDLSNSNAPQCLLDYFHSNLDILKDILQLDLSVQLCMWALITYLKPFGLDIAFELPIRLQHFPSHFTFHWSPSTLVHLGVFSKVQAPSLYSVLNHTNFPVSSRLLKTWLLRPLLSSDAILARQAAVQNILENWDEFTVLTVALRSLGDAEQLFMKIHYTRITPVSLYTFLTRWLDVIRIISSFQVQSPLLARLCSEILATKNEITCFFNSLSKEAAQSNSKIGLWQAQCLVDLQKELSEVSEALNSESNKEAEKVRGTVKHINDLEYVIEVPNSRSVPPSWVRVNSTTKTLRFHTPSLLDLLKRRDVIKATLTQKAHALYIQRLREFSQSSFLPFSVAIRSAAEIDCLWSLAKVAQLSDYTVPTISDEQIIKIEEGRHPVLETLVDYVPNSIELSYNGIRTLLLSGLNMGGKSSFVRMIALHVLLTQIGSHVPSRSAKLGIFDGIYTRIGASDDMVRGHSTFMVEMMETASILSKMTSRSLVILDELGRGTSTYDGMAIAHAVLKYCIDFKPCCLLFITHYLPLSSLAEEYPRTIRCAHMGFLKVGKEFTFLYKLVQGMAQSCHGLNVARLARIPESILSLATEKSRESELKNLLERACHQLVQKFSRLTEFTNN
ncbi:Mismatch repair protein msh3 [Coelomomyces lativittatus]|nr:Mismatch repair protein msh3 [Coelomomyces lativittatus]